MNNPKSTTTAGLLGIFLGGFGAHQWYLGGAKEKKLAIFHTALVGGGVLFVIISAIIISANTKTFFGLPYVESNFATSAAVIMSWAGYLAISGSSIWGIVEGIMILVAGDAGLAAKGYTILAPAAPVAQPYAQPAQPAAAPAQPATAPVAPTAAPAPAPAAEPVAPAAPAVDAAAVAADNADENTAAPEAPAA